MRNKFKLILFGLILMMFTGGAMAATTLSGGAVAPATGTISTGFDFTVTYTDTGNISASYVNVTIDSVPYSLNAVDSGDINTTDGKDYTRTLSGFVVGTHNYEFYAGNGSATIGPANAGSFTITNSAPVLSSAAVSPGSGSPATSFDFSVTYTDPDNTIASYMNVTIDSVSYAMNEVDLGDTNTADGKDYTYSMASFSTGTHEYNFSASDGNATVGPTGDGTFSVNSDSSISGTVSPGSGSPDTTFYFNATFTDADNNTATYVRVNINGTDHDMTEVDPADVNTTDGKLYTYNMAGFPIGTHDYYFKASDGTSTPQTSSASFSVDVSNHVPTLTDAQVSSDNNFIVGEKIYFNVVYTDSDNNASTFNYVQIDGVNKTMSKVDSGDNTATNGIEYTYNTTLALGNHSYRFLASDGTFQVSTSSENVTIYSKTYFTGDRIWDENAGQSTTYTWDAKSFSGFFYDLESGLSSETLTITDIDRTIGDADIVYETRPVEAGFEHTDWGKYQVIGFMAQKYFAGYTSNTSVSDVDITSMMSNGQLAKVLIDNDDKESVYAGSSLILEDGYKINVVEADTNGNKVLITLTKDGDELDSSVITSGNDYVYKTDLGDSDNVAIIIVRFDEIFSGTESNAVFIKGIFQIADTYESIEDGDSYGKMDITSISDEMIQMKNDGSVSLSRGKTIDIMGKIKFIVADDDTLRFAPFVDMSDPGTYELRGTVAEGAELLTWTPLNFEGFYYDIDEGIQTETLELNGISGRSISSGELVYTSTPASVGFAHSDWNKFNVIGFMAQKYFAGYPSGAFGSSSAIDLLSSGQLSKVLIDEDEKTSIYAGSSLILEEGYVLNIVEVDNNGNKVLVELSKDGDEVDSGIVSTNANYIYEMDLGDSDNVPIIAVHFNEIFRGSESNAVFVQGIFQISDEYTALEDGDKNGKMEITGIGSSIVMENSDSISLTRGKEISLMGDVVIRVADSDTLRYYPAVDVTTSANEALDVALSESTITEGDNITITVTARGASVSDATIKANAVTIGKTDETGIISYTPASVGTLAITAEKDGYTSGSQELVVVSKDDETRKMSIEVSPDKVYEGTSMTIFVLKAIGGDAISEAEVTFDGKSIGTTGSDGTVTYTATDVGTHKLVAKKSGFIDAELDLKVNEIAAEFSFSNLKISPLEIKQGQEATISVDVTNTGTAAGNYTVDLKINDVIVDSKPVTLGIGNVTTLEFKHKEKEMGTYTVKVGDLTTTYEVFEKSNSIWYVLGAIGLAAVGGVAYLFTAGGWTVEIAQVKVAEAIEAIKEFVGNLR